jgi:hypothetical protein
VSRHPGRTRRARPGLACAGLGAAASVLLGLLLGYALPGQPPGSSPSHDLLAVLGSTPPGALCARPEFCYLKVNLK